jgi:hypothetical protein
MGGEQVRRVSSLKSRHGISEHKRINEKPNYSIRGADGPQSEKLQPFADRANVWPHNLKIYNLCRIKKMGLEKWAVEKAAEVWSDYKTKKMDE